MGWQNTVGTHCTSKYPGVGRGWVHPSNPKVSVKKTGEHCKIWLGVGKGQMIQRFANHVNLIVPKFTSSWLSFRKCIKKKQEQKLGGNVRLLALG